MEAIKWTILIEVLGMLGGVITAIGVVYKIYTKRRTKKEIDSDVSDTYAEARLKNAEAMKVEEESKDFIQDRYNDFIEKLEGHIDNLNGDIKCLKDQVKDQNDINVSQAIKIAKMDEELKYKDMDCNTRIDKISNELARCKVTIINFKQFLTSEGYDPYDLKSKKLD